jgi:hypothetical protein
LLFFAAMAVLHSWPLASDPAHLARLDNHDAELNTWIVAWTAHVLPRHPLDLFEAPILHPEHHSLAFSEHMFVPSLLGAPLLWAGASPVLVYNLLIIAGLALSGWSMYLLMRRWTGSEGAAIVAGLIYAFNAHVLTRFVHLQAHHVEFFPLVLYAFDRVLVERRLRDVLLLSLAFVLQALCSNYLLAFTTYALIASAVVRWPELRTRKKRAPPQTTDDGGNPFLGLPAAQLLLAGVIAVILLAPFLWPYYEVSRDQGLVRGVSDVAQYNATWRDYLATGGRLHYAWWSKRFFEGRTALFPGLTALGLAVAAVISRRMVRDPRVRMTIAIGAIGFAISFGTALPGYAFLHEHLPLLGGLRNVARWGWLPLASIAILAGFGASILETRTWRYAPIALGLLVTVEAIRAPVGFTPVYEIPRLYDRFANAPDIVIAEFPFYSGANVSLNGPYVYANTRYFKPLLNGYSSFHPDTFEARGRALNSFPSEAALAELKVAHVTHVLVHVQDFERRYGRRALDAIDTIPELQFETEEEGIRLYHLK